MLGKTIPENGNFAAGHARTGMPKFLEKPASLLAETGYHISFVTSFFGPKPYSAGGGMKVLYGQAEREGPFGPVHILATSAYYGSIISELLLLVSIILLPASSVCSISYTVSATSDGRNPAHTDGGSGRRCAPGYAESSPGGPGTGRCPDSPSPARPTGRTSSPSR